jgi:hypothetical protein
MMRFDFASRPQFRQFSSADGNMTGSSFSQSFSSSSSSSNSSSNVVRGDGGYGNTGYAGGYNDAIGTGYAGAYNRAASVGLGANSYGNFGYDDMFAGNQSAYNTFAPSLNINIGGYPSSQGYETRYEEKPVPHIYLPQAPEGPALPHMPEVPYAPQAPMLQFPTAPTAPIMPHMPEVPYAPQAPTVHLPNAPQAPIMPHIPEVPYAPQAPVLHQPKPPVTPHKPDEPKLPVHTPKPIHKSLTLDASIDGLNATGYLGDLASRTVGLHDAAAKVNDSRYAVGSLYDVNTGLVSNRNSIVEYGTVAPKGNGIYLAGDPHVGGQDNSYASLNVNPNQRLMTVFKDGDFTKRGIAVNAAVEKINANGNVAYTQYGGTVKTETGDYRFKIADGTATVYDAQGKAVQLNPTDAKNNQFVFGNANDPAAVLRYGQLAGQEKRLILDYFQRPTAEAAQALTKAGITLEQANAVRTQETLSFGFRNADGFGPVDGMPQGTPDGKPLHSSNGVGTYYDAHLTLADGKVITL